MGLDPKSPRTGLTLYQVLDALPDILRCWTGTCTTCQQRLPGTGAATRRSCSDSCRRKAYRRVDADAKKAEALPSPNSTAVSATLRSDPADDAGARNAAARPPTAVDDAASRPGNGRQPVPNAPAPWSRAGIRGA